MGHVPLLGLPVWQTTKDAYAILYRNRASFLSIAAVPFIVSFATALLVTPERMGEWAFVAALAELLVFCVFATAWHRFVILERRDTNFLIQFTVKHAEIKYGFHFVIIFLLGMALGYVVQVVWIGLSPSSSIAQVVAIFAGPIAGALIAVRLALLFPAIAIGATTGIRDAWRQLKGSSWRLFLALVLVSIPPIVAGIVIDRLISGTMTGLFIGEALSWIHTGLVVTVVSLAYRSLVMRA